MPLIDLLQKSVVDFPGAETSNHVPCHLEKRNDEAIQKNGQTGLVERNGSPPPDQVRGRDDVGFCNRDNVFYFKNPEKYITRIGICLEL